MLSIETTTKLLKLHFRWPDRKQWDGKEDQPIEFFKWLFVNHHDKPEVMELEDVGMVEEFIERNKHVLWPGRKDEEKWANLRLEPRIDNEIKVDMTVMECDDIALIGESVYGKTLDIGLHGMRIGVNKNVPAGSILKLAVSNDTPDATVYPLAAELRWSSELEDGYLVGIKLIEDDEFRIWQQNFGAEFVAPAVKARRG